MKPKRLPRLWCALQGLLPLEAGREANHAPGGAWLRTREPSGLGAPAVYRPRGLGQVADGRVDVVTEASPLPFDPQGSGGVRSAP